MRRRVWRENGRHEAAKCLFLQAMAGHLSLECGEDVGLVGLKQLSAKLPHWLHRRNDIESQVLLHLSINVCHRVDSTFFC